MALESKSGTNQKVTLAANQIQGIATWSWSGITQNLADDSEFGDDYEMFLTTMKNGGTITCGGKFKVDDTTGQDVILAALAALDGSNVTDIRFYVDANSYYIPNSTTAAGGNLPANSPVSYLNITNFSMDAAHDGLATVSFTGQLSGPI